MSLYDDIIAIYPELTPFDFSAEGSISLRNDADSNGDYVESWNYSKPLPEELKQYLGKTSPKPPLE